jgi:FkbM family methyltransferase
MRHTVISVPLSSRSGLSVRLRATLGRLIYPDEVRVIEAVLVGDTPGVMVDVGANQGTCLLPFAKAGWRVHAFEPDPLNRAALEACCRHLEGVSIDPRALSDSEASTAPFFRSDVSPGISSLAGFHESHREVGSVEVTTLATYATEQHLESVDFLKTDTEGFDLFVLRGVPWDTLAPRVVLSEFENPKTEPLGYTLDDLAGLLVEQGYQVLVSEWFPVRQYGGPHRWRCFGSFPGRLADESAWGNLIAAREPAVFAALEDRARALVPWWKALGIVSRARVALRA